MNVNWSPKLVRYQDIISYCTLGLTTLGFVLFLFWQLNLYLHFMDQMDANTPAIVPSTREEESNYTLSIPKINLENIPIILDVNGSDKDVYLKSLENGVAHFSGTAWPGQKGNSFIFGHSSYYANKPGDYKRVFRNLNQLENGDLIEIKSDQNTYIYMISEKKIVQPKDIEILKQTKDFRLTLMTCWPIGSTAKRLVVIAKRTQVKSFE